MKFKDLSDAAKKVKFIALRSVLDVSKRHLTSLEGCEPSYQSSFYCNSNELTTLEHCPENILGAFNCSFNKLTNLKYSPKGNIRLFYCQNNRLETLEDLRLNPNNNLSRFVCTKNHKLLSLWPLQKYHPEEIKCDKHLKFQIPLLKKYTDELAFAMAVVKDKEVTPQMVEYFTEKFPEIEAIEEIF